MFSGWLYYHPKANEMDAATGTLLVPAVAPATDQLLVVNNASNLVFQNLMFEYTDWNLASATTRTEASHVGGQAGSETIATLSDQVGPAQKDPFDRATPPAILINRQDAQHAASNITFANNTITHVGGYAVQVHAANNQVIENTISDCGSGGIVLGDVGLSFSYAAAIEGFTSHNSIARNTIHALGAVMTDGLPIFATLVDHTRIASNEISDAGYTGISIGWRWSTYATSACDNTIVSNDIHDVMRVLYDGAGIYTLGDQSGTVISANTIHDIRFTDLTSRPDVRAWTPVNAIAMDSGSGGLTIYGNLMYNCEQGISTNGLTTGWRIESNLCVNMAGVGMWLPTLEEPTDPGVAGVFANNVFVWDKDWSPSSCGATLRPISTWGGTLSSNSTYLQDGNIYDTDIVPDSQINQSCTLEYRQSHNQYERNSSAADPGLSPLCPDEAFAYVLDRNTVQSLTNFTANWLLN